MVDNEEFAVTYAAVARWMLQEVRDNSLYQVQAAHEIRKKFGEEFVYTNENGNLAISRKVLKEFRRLTEKTVVWSRSEKCWHWSDASGGRGTE